VKFETSLSLGLLITGHL